MFTWPLVKRRMDIRIESLILLFGILAVSGCGPSIEEMRPNGTEIPAGSVSVTYPYAKPVVCRAALEALTEVQNQKEAYPYNCTIKETSSDESYIIGECGLGVRHYNTGISYNTCEHIKSGLKVPWVAGEILEIFSHTDSHAENQQLEL